MSTIRAVNLSLQIFGSIITIVIISCMIFPNRVKRKSDKIYLMLLIINMGSMLFDALALLFRGKMGFVPFVGVRLSNYLSFICNIIIAFVFLMYQKAFFERKTKKKISDGYLYTGAILTILELLFLTVNLFYPFIYQIDEKNLYSRLPMYPLIYVNSFVILLLSFILMMMNRSHLEKWEFFSFLFYICVPFVAVILTIASYGIVFGQMGSITALIVMYVYLQAEYGRRAAEWENELTKNKVTMMMSQIQPHFLFNSLSSIEMLCVTDPVNAGHSIHHFSRFLRKNMDSLTDTSVIPLEQELEHLENYLYIEKLRFPDITIEYDLECKNFSLPSLVLQPMVENAIKHGLSGLETGGCIWIHTWEDKDFYYLSVRDNGVGFRTTGKKEDERSHVGIANIRKRLAMLCQGDLLVESKEGEGARVTAKIAKESENERLL